jgi:hypothetical protein
VSASSAACPAPHVALPDNKPDGPHDALTSVLPELLMVNPKFERYKLLMPGVASG